jgi:hypothetical protein
VKYLFGHDHGSLATQAPRRSSDDRDLYTPNSLGIQAQNPMLPAWYQSFLTPGSRPEREFSGSGTGDQAGGRCVLRSRLFLQIHRPGPTGVENRPVFSIHIVSIPFLQAFRFCAPYSVGWKRGPAPDPGLGRLPQRAGAARASFPGKEAGT